MEVAGRRRYEARSVGDVSDAEAIVAMPSEKAVFPGDVQEHKENKGDLMRTCTASKSA